MLGLRTRGLIRRPATPPVSISISRGISQPECRASSSASSTHTAALWQMLAGHATRQAHAARLDQLQVAGHAGSGAGKAACRWGPLPGCYRPVQPVGLLTGTVHKPDWLPRCLVCAGGGQRLPPAAAGGHSQLHRGSQAVCRPVLSPTAAKAPAHCDRWRRCAHGSPCCPALVHHFAAQHEQCTT